MVQDFQNKKKVIQMFELDVNENKYKDGCDINAEREEYCNLLVFAVWV